MHQNSYVRNGWNMLDFVIVIVGWVVNDMKTHADKSVTYISLIVSSRSWQQLHCKLWWCETLSVNKLRHKGHSPSVSTHLNTQVPVQRRRHTLRSVTCHLSFLIAFHLLCFVFLSSPCVSSLLNPCHSPRFPRQAVQCGSGDDNQRRWFWRPDWRQAWRVWCQGPPSLSRATTPSPCLWSSQWVNAEFFYFAQYLTNRLQIVRKCIHKHSSIWLSEHKQ